MSIAPSRLQPTLALFDEPPVPYRERVVTDGSDRFAWLRARARGVTATDVARLSSSAAVAGVAMDKLLGTRFGGNAYTQHGLDREPAIARWTASVYGMRPSAALFHADGNRDHLATPDGLRERDGILELCEIKTTVREWRRGVPRHYLRQVWWQQYVLGAERTLVVWERHEDFVPVRADPECRWVDRDESEIHRLVVLADEVLVAMRRGA
ncbi:MAG: YqaJ viral recombinase family protein [Schumannella sp.]